MNKDIKALRQQLEQLQKSHREGSVGKKAFEAGKAQLEREILQAVLAAPEAAAAGAQAPRPSRALTAGVLSFVVVLAPGPDRRVCPVPVRQRRRLPRAAIRTPAAPSTRRNSSPPSNSWPNG